MLVATVLDGVHLAAAAGDVVSAATAHRDDSSASVPGAVLPSRQVLVPAGANRPAYWAFVPTGPAIPRTILLALHGMGQVGASIGGQLMPFAQEKGWIIVAPTVDYGEWRDPARLASAEARLLPQVLEVVEHARRELGVPTRERFVVFGFSRGAHAAARIGLIYPARVVGVAAASGSAYTLPTGTARNASGRPVGAPFPFGSSDVSRYFGRSIDAEAVARVQYWVGVGANDNRDADVPRTWDAFIGRNRLERAVRFAHAMEEAGSATRISVTPNAGHELTPSAMDDGVTFLAGALAVDSLRDASGARDARATPSRSVAPLRPVGQSLAAPVGGFLVPPDSIFVPSAMAPLLARLKPSAPSQLVPATPWTRTGGRQGAQ